MADRWDKYREKSQYRWERYRAPDEPGTTPRVPEQRSAVTLSERAILQTVAPADPEAKAQWLRGRGYETQALPSGQVAVARKDGSGWGVIDSTKGELMDLVDAADEIAFGVASGFGALAGSPAGPLGQAGGAAVGAASSEAVKKALGAAAGFHEEPGKVLGDVALSGALGGTVELGLLGLGKAARGAAKMVKGKPYTAPDVPPEAVKELADVPLKRGVHPPPIAPGTTPPPVPPATARTLVEETTDPRAAFSPSIREGRGPVRPSVPPEGRNPDLWDWALEQGQEVAGKGKWQGRAPEEVAEELYERLRTDPDAFAEFLEGQERAQRFRVLREEPPATETPPARPAAQEPDPMAEPGPFAPKEEVDPRMLQEFIRRTTGGELSLEDLARLQRWLPQAAKGQRPAGIADEEWLVLQEFTETIMGKRPAARAAPERRVEPPKGEPVPPPERHPGISEAEFKRLEAEYEALGPSGPGVEEFSPSTTRPAPAGEDAPLRARAESLKARLDALQREMDELGEFNLETKALGQSGSLKPKIGEGPQPGAARPTSLPPEEQLIPAELSGRSRAQLEIGTLPGRSPRLRDIVGQEPAKKARTMREFRPTAKPISHIRTERGKLRPEPPPIRGGVDDFEAPKPTEGINAPRVRADIQQHIDDVVNDIAGGNLGIDTIEKIAGMQQGLSRRSSPTPGEWQVLLHRVSGALDEAQASGAIDEMQRGAFTDSLRGFKLGERATPYVPPQAKVKPQPEPAARPDLTWKRTKGGQTLRFGDEEVGWFEGFEEDLGVEIYHIIQDALDGSGRLSKEDRSALWALYRNADYGDKTIGQIIEKIEELLSVRAAVSRPPISGGVGKPPKGGGKKKKPSRARKVFRQLPTVKVARYAIDLAKTYAPGAYDVASKVVEAGLARIQRVLEKQGRIAAQAAAYALVAENREFRAWLESQMGEKSAE